MKLSYIFAIFSAVTLYSCTDEIQIDLPDPEPRLVIDGKMSQDSVNIITLSEIQNYFANTPPNFNIHKNAQINLFEDSIQVDTYVFNDSLMLFESDYAAQPNHYYHIEMQLSNGENYVSSPEWVEEVSPIDTIWYDIEDGQFNEEDEGQDIIVKLNTYEPAGLGDYYQWKVYVNDEYLSEPFDLSFTDDRFVDGQYVTDFEVFVFNEKKYKEYQDKSATGQVFVRVEQHRITQGYYNFLFEVFQQTVFSGGPFSSPPAEIRGNVYVDGEPLNLALGYFSASNYDSRTIEVIVP